MPKKNSATFEVRWIADVEKGIKDFCAYPTEGEAKTRAAAISEEFEKAQIGKIETDKEGNRTLTWTWVYEKGAEVSSEARDKPMEAETETKSEPKESKVSKTATKKSTANKPAKVAKKGAAKKPVAKRANPASGQAGPRPRPMPEKQDFSTPAGFVSALNIRMSTNREKLVKMLLKDRGKYVSRDKLRTGLYGDEENNGLDRVLFSIECLLTQYKAPFVLDKKKEGKNISYAIVKA